MTGMWLGFSFIIQTKGQLSTQCNVMIQIYLQKSKTQVIKYQNLPLKFDGRTLGYSLKYCKKKKLYCIFFILPVVCTVDLWPSVCVCMSSELLLLSLSCLFSRLSECVSLHWPSFRSYREMAAPLKFNPLSRHSLRTDKSGRENGRDSQAGIQGNRGMYLTTDMHTHTQPHTTHTHAHFQGVS